MTPMYYRGAHVALIVYSITDRESFEGIDYWCESLCENIDSSILIFLVASKCDLEEERQISTKEGQVKAKSIGAHFYEVSARTNVGIDDLFNDIPKFFFEKHSEAEDAKKLDIGKPQKKKNKWWNFC